MFFPRKRIEVERLVGQIGLRPLAGHITVGDVTVSTDSDDTRANALLLHIGELSRATQQLQIATISYINFAGLISVGTLTVGIIKPERLVGIFAPYALTVVLAFLLQLYTDIERLITLREIVETHLNGTLRAPAFLGINQLSSKYRGRVSVRLVAPLLVLPLLGIGSYSVSQTAKLHPRWHGMDLHWVNVGGLVFCALVLGWAASEMLRAHSLAIREACETMGTTPSEFG